MKRQADHRDLPRDSRFLSRPFDAQLEELGTGDHVCFLCEDRQQATDSAGRLIRIGLDRGEKCVYICGEYSVDSTEQALATSGVDVKYAEQTGLLEVMTDYFPPGPRDAFDEEAYWRLVESLTRRSRTRELPGFRLVADMSWLRPWHFSADALRTFEARWTVLCDEIYGTVACLYDFSTSTSEELSAALVSHPVAMFEAQLCGNPYFEPPELVISKADLRERLSWRIRDLKEACASRNQESVRDRELHERLEAALREAESERVRRQEWTAMIAHDFRQPATVISTFVALMSRQLERAGVSNADRALDHIRSSVHTLDQMIQDLLDLSRFEAGRLNLIRKRVELQKLVGDTVERQESALGRHPVRIEVTEVLPPVDADRARIEQVITNLLSNAGRYSFPDTEIRVVLTPREGFVEVAVINQGEGIAPEDVPKLFGRFQRIPGAQDAPGIGLGLYMSKWLVEAHGGKIWVESTPGETTAFRFTLPVAD